MTVYDKIRELAGKYGIEERDSIELVILTRREAVDNAITALRQALKKQKLLKKRGGEGQQAEVLHKYLKKEGGKT